MLDNLSNNYYFKGKVKFIVKYTQSDSLIGIDQDFFPYYSSWTSSEKNKQAEISKFLWLFL